MALSMSILGCSDSFLELEQEGSITSGSFWQTADDAISASNTLYDLASDDNMYGRGFFWYINASDDMVTGRVKSDPDNMKNFKCNGNEGYTKNIWELKYKVIKRANDIIRNLPEMDIDEVLKKRIMGEAYFMAGLNYFELAYRYGDGEAGIPILDPLKPLEYDIPRAVNVQANYEYCVNLFAKAVELLPELKTYTPADYGRAHKQAAYGYMAKTYLYWAQYDASKYTEAVIAADNILQAPEFHLIDTDSPAEDFRAVFTAANNFDSEYIWSVVSNNQTGSILPGVMFENKGWGLYNGWGYYQPTKELFDEYEAGDARRDVTIFKEGTVFKYFGHDFTWTQTANNVTGYMFGKYTEPYSDESRVNPNGDKPSVDLNVPLMRYAEVLLIKAEALIMQGENGDVSLNKVRDRSGLAPISGADMDDLKHERRCELAGEWADRHFDLVRWGDADKTYEKPLHDYLGNEVWPARSQFDPSIHHVWPIPPHVIDASNGVIKANKW